MKSKNFFLQKLRFFFEKSRNPIFSKMAEPILMTKIYCISITYIVAIEPFSRKLDFLIFQIFFITFVKIFFKIDN